VLQLDALPVAHVPPSSMTGSRRSSASLSQTPTVVGHCARKEVLSELKIFQLSNFRNLRAKVPSLWQSHRTRHTFMFPKK
jgi:hypothetical protein